MDRRAELRNKALEDLQHSGVLMIDGHFDYGNGYHGRVYLNPHQLFRHPSTIWRFAQDLIDLMPGDLVQRTEVVAGPVTGGALLAHTIAGLLDSRRSLTHPPCSFAPFNYDPAGGFTLRAFYREELNGKRVLLADDVRNTGQTFARCSELVKEAGGTVVLPSRSTIARRRWSSSACPTSRWPSMARPRISRRRSARSARRKYRSRRFEHPGRSRAPWLACVLVSFAEIQRRGWSCRRPKAPCSICARSIRIFRCRTACQSFRPSS